MIERDASDAEVATDLGVGAVVTQPSASPAGILIGYARCSTEKQELTAQREILRGLGVVEEDRRLSRRSRGSTVARRFCL
jgi:hypothetical protein